MSRKIIGATVGTSISPEILKKKMGFDSDSDGVYVKTVNNVSPDEKGNVAIDVKETLVVSFMSDNKRLNQTASKIVNAVANKQCVILKLDNGEIYNLDRVNVNTNPNIAPSAVFSKTYISEGNVVRAEYKVDNKGLCSVTQEIVESSGVDAPAFDPTAYGLPVLYLAGNTAGMSKDNAVALDYVYGDHSGTASVKWQGSSSLAYPKKNYTIKFDNAFEAAPGWGEQKKYCLKANYIDHSHARNIVSARLWGDVVRSREMHIALNGSLIPDDTAYTYENNVLTANFNFNDYGAFFLADMNLPEAGYTITCDVFFPEGSTDLELAAYFKRLDSGVDGMPKATATAAGVWETVSFPELWAAGSSTVVSLSGYRTSGVKFRNIRFNGLYGAESFSYAPMNQIQDLPNGGAIDGFPVCVYINGQYTGLYTFNIPKDGWMFGLGGGTQECVLSAKNHSPATRFEAPALCDGSDFEIEYITDEANTAWVVESANRLISAVMNSNGTDIDSTIAKYLDIQSAIDFYIFTALQSGGDNVDKNYLLSTYDGGKWFFSTYDMDSTFGNDWTGKNYTSVKNAPTLLDFSNKVMQLLRDYKTVDVKNRYNQLRSTVLSEDNVLLAFENFIAGIPSALYEHDTKLWPLIPGTKTNNISQIANFYRLRVQLLDAQIEQIKQLTAITNLVPTATDPKTGEVYNGVGYKDGVVAIAPEYGYEENKEGIVATGLISFPAYSITAIAVNPYISPVLYVKGNVSFDDPNTTIVSYQTDGSYCHQTNQSAFANFYNIEELSTGYYKITYKTETNTSGIDITTIHNWLGKYPEKVQLSMTGTGEGLIVTLNEPIA